MVGIIVHNSTCRIDGLDVKQFATLRNLMSYSLPPEQAFYGGHKFQGKRHLLTKRGEFPTGLLYIAQDYLKDNKIAFQVKDTRIAIKADLSFPKLTLPFTPHPEQRLAAEAARRQKRGIVTAPTGSGKSLICALIIDALKVKTLVVVPSLELKKQLLATFKEYFDIKAVGQLHENRHIVVENVDALDPKKPLKGYHCVIIDEFHHSGATTYQKLNKYAWNDVYFKFGLTATPFRSKDEERLLLESVLSKVIYRVDYHLAVSKGYIVPMEAYYIDIPKTKIKGNERSWPAMYSELVVNNAVRNNIITGLLTTLSKSEISTLCLVKEVKHGQNLLEGLPHIKFVTGSDEDSRQYIQDFNQRKEHALIGTNGIMGEGVDSKPCEYVIIAGLGKSKNQFMQQVGRGFRTYPSKETCKIIIFRDKSHSWTIKHFNAQVKYLREEYGCEPVKLDFY